LAQVLAHDVFLPAYAKHVESSLSDVLGASTDQGVLCL